MRKIYLILIVMLAVSGCGDKEDRESKDKVSGMKCGAGKCGANMFDGNSALAKKKKNILSQIRENDPRKDCVIKAKTTRETYDCVRNPYTSKLTIKCGNGAMAERSSVMRCGGGKCGGSI